MKIFVDSWGWLTLGDSLERQHHPVSEFYRKQVLSKSILVTSDFVLDETITRVFKRRPFPDAWRFVSDIISAQAAELLRVERIHERRFTTALQLRKRYSDKPRISFTDLTSMALMRELDITDVLTANEHFRQVGLGFRLLPE